MAANQPPGDSAHGGAPAPPPPDGAGPVAGNGADAQPAVLAALERIEARLARLEAAASSPVQGAKEVVATAVDSFDERVNALAERGVDVDQRMRRMGDLLEQLTRPEMLGTLSQAVELAETVPQGLAAATDTFDSIVARLHDAGIDVDGRLHIVLRVAERLTAPEALAVVSSLLANVDAVRRLLESGILSEGAVKVVSRAAWALSQVDPARVQPMGPFGALKAVRDPCIQRALGVLVDIGKNFGKTMRPDADDPFHPCQSGS